MTIYNAFWQLIWPDIILQNFLMKVDLKTVEKTIRQRLLRTQTYWKDLNNRTPPHRGDDDNDDTTAVPYTMQERAEGKVTLTRHRMHGTKVRIDLKLSLWFIFL